MLDVTTNDFDFNNKIEFISEAKRLQPGNNIC